MQLRQSILTVVCTLLLSLQVYAQPLLVEKKIITDEYFRPWASKGLGEKTNSGLISLIAHELFKGDVIILWWKDEQFTTEIYVPDLNQEHVWRFKGDSESKTLSLLNHQFQLTQLIAGAEGGQKIILFPQPKL